MYIMENAEIVPNLTTKVSADAGASEASVVRFVSRLGLGALKHLKSRSFVN